MQGLLDAAATLISEKAAQEQLELVMDVAPDAPQHLVGDALRLRQILINCANNAVKFTEAGEIGIVVRVSQASTGQAALVLLAEDNLLNQQVATEILAEAGVAAAVADNGRGPGGRRAPARRDALIAQLLALLEADEPEAKKLLAEHEPVFAAAFWRAVQGGAGRPCRLRLWTRHWRSPTSPWAVEHHPKFRMNDSSTATPVPPATVLVVDDTRTNLSLMSDLLGDLYTVNTASRMESTSTIGRAQVSASMHQELKDSFSFEPHGVQEFKGLGQVETYLLGAELAPRFLKRGITRCACVATCTTGKKASSGSLVDEVRPCSASGSIRV